MFGIVIAHLSKVSEQEKQRYQAVYCGLCRALKERYGQASRVCLTYDLTFFILLANSLNEPAEETGEEHCLTHPVKKMPYACSAWTDYAADLAVALAYHKCLDDVHDEGTVRTRAAAKLLSGAYAQAKARIPSQCEAVERAMAEITRIESEPKDGPQDGRALNPTFEFSPDAAANVFGTLLGELFAHNQGTWANPMRTFGNELGRFIYLMDAAVDYADDAKSGSYNPLVQLEMQPQDMKTLLSVLIGNAADTFEKLPLVQDVHLMRSVLYSGVWQKFNETYHSEDAPKPAQSATAAKAAAAAASAAPSVQAKKEHHD